MSTVIDAQPRGNCDRHQRWERSRRAERLKQYRDLQAQGLSPRQAANKLDVPRTTLQAWRAWQDRLDACPQVVEFFESVPGPSPIAWCWRSMWCVEIGACGIRLVCLWLQLTELNRFVDASCGMCDLLVQEALIRPYLLVKRHVHMS